MRRTIRESSATVVRLSCRHPMQRSASLLRFILVSLCAGLMLAAAAGAGSRHAAVGHAGGFPFAGFSPSLRGGPKLDSALTRVAHSSRSGAAPGLAAARSQKLDVEGQKVRVIVRPRAGQAAAARTLLRDAGATIAAEADGLIEAEVWPGSLERISGSGAVAQVRKPARPVLETLNNTSLTSVTPVNEAVDRTSASAWQAAGYDGSGVKIAIIDAGFYGYQAELGAGLPASVTAIDHCSGNLDAPPPTGTEHGTAVAEIVHQMAPGAQLYLMCMDSEVGLAQSVDDAINAGVRVVNHSVGWFNTSRGDGTGGPGTPEYDVANARAHGIVWANAAGNTNDHWNGTFTPNATSPNYLDFAPGDPGNTIQLVNTQEVCVYLRWDEWPTSTNDYDLLLFDQTTGQLVAASGDEQSPDNPGTPGRGALLRERHGSDAELRDRDLPLQRGREPAARPARRRRHDAVRDGGQHRRRAGVVARGDRRRRRVLAPLPVRQHDQLLQRPRAHDRRARQARPRRARLRARARSTARTTAARARSASEERPRPRRTSPAPRRCCSSAPRRSRPPASRAPSRRPRSRTGSRARPTTTWAPATSGSAVPRRRGRSRSRRSSREAASTSGR